MAAHYISKSKVAFRFRQLDFVGEPGTLAQYSTFFSTNGDDRSFAVQKWRHRDNPAGQSFATIAEEDKDAAKWAALYVTSPVIFDVAGKKMLGSQSLDTLTDANYRGQGLFPRLAEADYRYSETQGTRFVYGFPNANSAPGFFGKLGWSELAPVPFLMKPLRLSYFARQLLRKRKVILEQASIEMPADISGTLPRGTREIRRFDEQVTRLWQQWAGNDMIGIRRDAEYLNWRLFDRPDTHYRVLAHYDDDGMDGYIAFCVARKHGGTIGYVMEFLVAPGKLKLAKRLLKPATEILRRAGADVVLAWCLPASANYAGFRREGYWPLPERLRPIELHFGVRAFDPALKDIVAKRDRWYLSYLDSDTV